MQFYWGDGHFKNLYDERLGGEEMIIPVPLHRSRLKERGFNQAELVAKYVSKYTSIPMYANTLKRIKKTKPQYEMTLEERQKNLRNAFRVVDETLLSEKSILVIDDIFTTGSTAYEVSKTLKKAGSGNVNFLTVCRALPFV
jgi:competence protein ComFC